MLLLLLYIILVCEQLHEAVLLAVLLPAVSPAVYRVSLLDCDLRIDDKPIKLFIAFVDAYIDSRT